MEQRGEDDQDNREYLEDWARKLVGSASPEDVRALVAEYDRIAKSPRRAAADRRTARRRARILRKSLSTNT